MSPHTKTWTKDAFQALLGVPPADKGERIELLEGELFEMCPQSDDHANPIAFLTNWFVSLFGGSHIVRVQLPLDLGEVSQPEPDFAIVARSDHPRRGRPTRADLIIEIAVTSLEFDRRRKASVYAKARLPEFWILNVIAEQLEVFREPAESSGGAYGFTYLNQRIYRVGDVLRPLLWPDLELPVARLLQLEPE